MRFKTDDKKRIKEVVYVSDKEKLAEEKHYKFYLFMYNLKTNFNKFFDIAKFIFSKGFKADDNLKNYKHKPGMSDCAII